jgi:hypothetical protein
MGCGLKELKLIFGIIKEVAANRQIPEYMAVQKFFEDIEKNYDNKLGYDSTLECRRSEIEKTNMELNILHLSLGSLKKVVRALSDIVSIGYDEQQVLNLAWALQSNTSNVCCGIPRKEYPLYRFFQNFSKLYATALAIEVVCICAAEIGENSSFKPSVLVFTCYIIIRIN